MTNHEATEQAYKKGYEDGYREGKERSRAEIAFPRFLVSETRRSEKELEALLYSAPTIIKDKTSVTQIYPYTRWIPVTERLPERYQNVLTVRADRKIRFDAIGSLDAWYEEVWHTGNPVTHWMPLPEPPKGE